MGTSVQKMSPLNWPVGKTVKNHFLDLSLMWNGLDYCVHTTLGLVVLGAIGNQDEQAMRSKPVSSTPSCPLHQLLPLGSSLEFLSSLPSVMGCYLRVVV